MNSKDLMKFELLISSNNMLLKMEKEKDLWRFLGINNTVIHKIEYTTTYWSCSFGRIKNHQIIYALTNPFTRAECDTKPIFKWS